jgi:hypothetical protein
MEARHGLDDRGEAVLVKRTDCMEAIAKLKGGYYASHQS